MSYERLLELANNMINHIQIGRNNKDTIETLFTECDFKKDELINTFGFDENDVNDVIQSIEIM